MWAPWRLAYVSGSEPPAEGCVFCAHAAATDDRADYVLHRGEHCFVVLNRFPYNTGHLMVVPYRHVDSLQSLQVEEANEMMALVRASQRVVMDGMAPHGFNVGVNEGSAAGAGIAAHLHMHLLPRWSGDTNFMPTLGGTRVIPQHLDETYDLLLEGFRS
jgi:ATP adenylyltransferase